jgi:hypothetical protein
VRKALDQLNVPTGIRDQVLERVSHLSDDARSLLAAAAVLQTPVLVPVLLVTCEMPEDRALVVLDGVRSAGFFVDDVRRVGFRHVLAAQAMYEDLPGSRPRLIKVALNSRAIRNRNMAVRALEEWPAEFTPR